MTSLFFDFVCQGGSKAVATCTAWCKTEDCLAVATEDGQILFYVDEGVQIKDAAISRPGHTPTVMDWHPKAKILAVGWSDGQVSVWCVSDKMKDCSSTCSCANAAVHRSPLTFAVWSASGSRLITGDSAGTACAWKGDTRGNITPSVQYRKKSPLTAAVFCGIRSKKKEPRGSTSGVGGAGGVDAMAAAQALQPSFFFGTESGVVCYADDLGHCSDVQQLGSSVDTLAFYDDAMRLVVITRSLLMTQLQVGDDARVTTFMKVKLSVSAAAVAETGLKNVTWVGPGLLAAATGESLVRFWDLANDENYTLSLSSVPPLTRSDRAATLSFDPSQRTLAVGTREGYVAMWRFVGEYSSDLAAAALPGGGLAGASTSADDWEAQPPVNMGAPIGCLCWSSFGVTGLLAATAAGPDGGTAYVLSETVLHAQLSGQTAVLQTSARTLSVEYEKDASGALRVDCDINAKALSLSGDALVVLSGKQGQIIRLIGPGIPAEKLPPFDTTARMVVVDETRDQIFLAVDSRLEILNLSGGYKSAVTCTEGEGNPIHAHLNGNFLAVVTDRGIIKIYDVSKRERKNGLPLRPVGTVGRFVSSTTGEPLGAVRSIRCNADGTRVSLLSDKLLGGMKIREPDTCLYVYDADKDMIVPYDFASSRRYPTAHCWDTTQPQLLACETRRIRGRMLASAEKQWQQSAEGAAAGGSKIMRRDSGESKTGGVPGYADDAATAEAAQRSAAARSAQLIGGAGASTVEVTTLFVTSESGVLMQDSFALEPPMDALLGLQVPRLFFITTAVAHSAGSDGTSWDGRRQSRLMYRTLRDFVGMDDADPQTTRALLDFGYYLTVGDMDRAYSAVRLIRNTAVWENMAHMCVKTKRLDVAEVCLGNMGYARGAAAVRVAKVTQAELEARIAQVAIQLGLLDDAVRLFTECKRYDLLGNLYRSTGLWERAIQVAEEHDRIHLKATYHLYGLHLERVGDTAGAIKHFEAADTHAKEVPRMMFEKGRMADLETYIASSQDPELLGWWAKYQESLGNHETAREIYARCGDKLSLVRLACYSGNMDKAAEIARTSDSPAAAYHLARQHEAMGNIQEAVAMYGRSGCYNQAIRLAKTHGMDTELMAHAMQARPSQMVSVGAYFEAKGEFERAVQLYQKGGDIPRALDLCFTAGKGGRPAMFEALKGMAEEVGATANTSPQVLARCAEFFVQNGHSAKAVHLYTTAGKFMEAIQLCSERKVKITDDMAEALTPDKEAKDRVEVLMELANTCKRQGSFHLACKKFTQAGDRTRAMKCLLKTGDTKNIIYYASVGKSRDMYILAANYLQNLDWHNDVEVMKAIIGFYSKAKAFDQLATFYEACAQVEVNEYRDYEKALGAMSEAEKCLMRAKSAGAHEALLGLQRRTRFLQRFAEARRLSTSDPVQMVQLCTDLLAEDPKELETAIRTGDCFALLVEWHTGRGDWPSAHQLLVGMKERGVPLSPYIEAKLVEDICRGVGGVAADFQDPVSTVPRGIVSVEDDDDEVIDEAMPHQEEEEVLDEEDNNYK